MRFVELPAFRWTDKRRWAWPDRDRTSGLEAAAFQVGDLEELYKYVAAFGLVVQAGGACGVWPKCLATRFEQVKTFEPDPDNFACLVENCDEGNIRARRAALGAARRFGSLHRVAGNAGAGWVEAAEEVEDVTGECVRILTIDGIGYPRLDALVLDVEGAELEVLEGAAQSIEKFRPAIMIEVKSLPHAREPRAEEWLIDHGYRARHIVSRDKIYTAKAHS